MLSACSSNIRLNNPEGVILSEEAYYPKKFSGVGIETTAFWKLSESEAKKSNQIIERCLADPSTIIENKLKEYSGDNMNKERDFYRTVLEKLHPLTVNICANMWAIAEKKMKS